MSWWHRYPNHLTTMKQVIYKEIVQIDGVDYMIHNCDCSEIIDIWISNKEIEDDNDKIIDCILNDIMYSS
jgi:hypothetical protein